MVSSAITEKAQMDFKNLGKLGSIVSVVCKSSRHYANFHRGASKDIVCVARRSPLHTLRSATKAIPRIIAKMQVACVALVPVSCRCHRHFSVFRTRSQLLDCRFEYRMLWLENINPITIHLKWHWMRCAASG